MEALFRWLVNNGWDYSVVTYAGTAVFTVVMLAIYFYIKGDDRS
jgi:hypothetical protein